MVAALHEMVACYAAEAQAGPVNGSAELFVSRKACHTRRQISHLLQENNADASLQAHDKGGASACALQFRPTFLPHVFHHNSEIINRRMLPKACRSDP